MSLLENPARFCVFCYRSENDSINELAESSNLYLFLKLVGRFNGDSGTKLEKQMKLNQFGGLSMSQILGCCEGCLVIVNEFCEIYHQFKCLEMQLEWKIDKLMKIIKSANRVPSRVSQVTKALQMQQTEDSKEALHPTDTEKLHAVRTFRNCFAQQCRQRLKRCQPHILLSKNDAALTNLAQAKHKFSKPSNKNPTPTLDDQLIRETEKLTAADIVDQIVILGSHEINFQSIVSSDPKITFESNTDDNCRDDVINEQYDDTLDDNDSLSSHEFLDDPVNIDDFSEDETQEKTLASVQNNTVNCSLIQTKLEFPQTQTDEEKVTQIVSKSIPRPDTSFIMEDVFSALPLPLSEVLSKTSLCKICKKHFISEDWLNKHIKKDHTEVLQSKSQKSVNLTAGVLNQNQTPSFIETCLKKANIKPLPTILSQQRYSLHERISIAKCSRLAEIESDNDDDMEYTEDKSCSSSNASDFEGDDIKPIKRNTKDDTIKITKIHKLSNFQDKAEYTNCKICNKKTTRKLLDAHLKTWHDIANLDDTQIIKCKTQSCQAYFLTQEQLNFHKRYEHNTIFRCHICQKTFSIKQLLNEHIRFDHGRTLQNPVKILEDSQFNPVEFKCNFCTFIATSPTKLAIHETEHALPLFDEPSNLICPRCPYKYSRRRQRYYVVHHLRHHLSYLTGESSGACEMCSKGKVYVENTKQHFDRHHNTDLVDDSTKIFKCDECHSYYLKSFQLHRHKIRIHPSKACEICEKTFKTRKILLSHKKLHHKDHQRNPALPVPCDWPNCKKRFSTEGELEHHRIYSHKRNPEEQKGSVICDTCGKGFRSVGLLKIHMEKTHVEKSWICTVCGKCFKIKKTFDMHMEFHKGPESWKFECKECGKKCMDKWRLASHMNTHTKEKPWICQFCGEKYAHRHNWRNHLKGKHMDEEGVDEIVNSKNSQRKGNYLSRKGTKKGDCLMAPDRI